MTPVGVSVLLQGTGRVVIRQFAAAAWVWLAVAIPSLTDAGCDFEMWLVLTGSGLAMAAVWVVAAPWFFRIPRTLADRVWWFAIPLAGLIGVLLASTDRDLALRVALSEPALLDHAAAMTTGADEGNTPTRVGLFWVRQTQEYHGAVFFYTRQSFLNQEGVAYLPPGTAPPPRIMVKRLYGPWHTFVWSF